MGVEFYADSTLSPQTNFSPVCLDRLLLHVIFLFLCGQCGNFIERAWTPPSQQTALRGNLTEVPGAQPRSGSMPSRLWAGRAEGGSQGPGLTWSWVCPVASWEERGRQGRPAAPGPAERPSGPSLQLTPGLLSPGTDPGAQPGVSVLRVGNNPMAVLPLCLEDRQDRERVRRPPERPRGRPAVWPG